MEPLVNCALSIEVAPPISYINDSDKLQLSVNEETAGNVYSKEQSPNANVLA